MTQATQLKIDLSICWHIMVQHDESVVALGDEINFTMVSNYTVTKQT